MQFILKKLSIVFLAVVAVSAAVSASASAEACRKNAGKVFVLCVAGEQIKYPAQAEFESVLKTGTTASLLNQRWQEGGLRAGPIVCSTNKGQGRFLPGKEIGESVKSWFTSSFDSCAFEKEPYKTACTVGGIGIDILYGSFGPSLAETVALGREAEGFTVSEFLVKRNAGNEKCRALEGQWRMTSPHSTTLECVTPEVQVEKVEQQLKCEASKSHLEIGEAKVELGFTATLRLVGEYKGKKFSVIET